MEFNLPNIIVIIAAAQGLLLAILIIQKHRALFANRYLALLMLSYTGILIHLLLQDTGIYVSLPYFFLISGLSLAALPFHYLYTKHLVRRSQRFDSNELFHFIPFGIYEIILIVVIYTSQSDLSLVGVVSATDTPPILRLYNVAVIVQGMAYLGLSTRMINRFNLHIKDVVSSVEKIQLIWLRNITFTGFAAISVFLIEDLFLMNGINLSNFIFSSVGFALYVYGMGYGGLLKSEIFADPVVEKTMQAVEEIEHTIEEESAVKYERSGLTDETAEQHLRALLRLMEQKKIYRNCALTLTELSAELSVSPHNLSEVINTKLRKNFYDFVNGYRLDEVKKDLADPSKQHLKILSLAFDAGFNSKATFNTLFKEQTGTTPSEYRKTVLVSPAS
ncbi:MAG: helix-turn-helix domain-containing protein [Bacteroidota bacterium]